MDQNINKWLYWTPRIVAILFTAFLVIFSIDVFEEGRGLWPTIGALLLHNIPVFILALLIYFAWQREIVGAITFFVGGVLYIAQMVYNTTTGEFEWYMFSYSLIIGGPAFLISYLFYLNWRWRKKNENPTEIPGK